jgi:hypothetical protein
VQYSFESLRNSGIIYIPSEYLTTGFYNEYGVHFLGGTTYTATNRFNSPSMDANAISFRPSFKGSNKAMPETECNIVFIARVTQVSLALAHLSLGRKIYITGYLQYPDILKGESRNEK